MLEGTLSMDRFGGLGRAVALGVFACVGATLAQSCAFPDYTFISDEEFYGKGGSSGAGGADASAGGVAGSGGKASGGGSSTGGESFVHPQEGGPPKTDSGPPSTGGAAPVGDSGLLPDGAPPCTPGLSLCGDTCFDFLTDVNHCGDCTTKCATGEVCSAGDCAAGCVGGLAECTPTGSTTKICVDTATDENHCSRCNTPCAPGTICEGSQCVVDCGTKTRCGTLCVDTTTDDTHCGNCTTNCTALGGQVCSGSTCKPNCTPPFVACGLTCINPLTDDKNCNGCGKPCTATQACVSGTCTTLVENCQNGSDDDRDGNVDCADSDCTPKYACASLPSGWQGPVAIWAGNVGAAPSCSASGGYSTQFLAANAGLVVPPYACPSCACSKSTGMYCDDLLFDLFDTTDCTGSNFWNELSAPINGGCDDWTLCDANPSAQSAKLSGTPSSYVHGTCTPSQAAPQFPATSWTSEVRGCGSPASSGGGCGIGQCFPKPSAPFGAALCIFRAGIASCPADYPVQRPAGNQQYYQSVLDGRSCTACSCDPQCGGTVSVYTTPTCSSGTGTPIKQSGGDTCVQIPADTTQSGVSGGGCSAMRDTRALQWTSGGPVCAASASDVRGAPTPESPVTVCCQP
jgi:hypothetical protein